MELGGIRSQYDSCLFLWHQDDGSLKGVLALHVDDFVFCGTYGWHELVITSICKTFKISKRLTKRFHYLGLNIMQTKDAVYVDQYSYIQELEVIQMDGQRALQKDDVLTEEEKRSLKKVCGQLSWVSTNTRPDMAYDVCVISNYGKEPMVKNILAANKAISKIKKTDVRMIFPKLGNPEFWEILAYTDATHASLPNGSSQGGYIIFIKGNNRVAPIAWRTKKLQRVTKSPLASETSALAEGADAGYHVAAMLNELFGVKHKLKTFTDNKSLYDHIRTNNTVEDLRLCVDMARLKEMVEVGEIEIKWIEGKRQLADPLTKMRATAAHLVRTLTTGTYH